MKAWNPGARYFLLLAVLAVVVTIALGCLPFPDRDPTWVTPSSPASVPPPGSASR